ncbi:MAG: ribosome maturation factor RimP [Rhodospirillaceae bacterium]|nr:ribosome maturation factor RimP [Rhodospirillaceae bacterium]
MKKLIGKPISIDYTNKIEKIVYAPILNIGYDVVRIQFVDKSPETLQIMIERQDGRQISVDDCGVVSRMVSTLLDVNAPFLDDFTLEVSSPGVDRPLIKVADFIRFEGFVAKIETLRKVSGKKNFLGKICKIVDDKIEFECNGRLVTLAFEQIKSASLVITDELIEHSRQQTGLGSRMEH